MLERVDKVFAAVTWLAAAIVVVMLLFGPALIAHDRANAASGASPYGAPATATAPAPGATAVDGNQVFTSNCGSCHTLAAAGTTGQIGPNLDQVSLTATQVANQVRQGGGSMPAFAGKLSDAEIQAVAAFVARSH
jgi:mono/diheme cytochrome c family protein